MFSEYRKEKCSLDKLPDLAMPNIFLKASNDSAQLGRWDFPKQSILHKMIGK